MAKSNEIPSQFVDGPDSHVHLLRALAFLGEKVPAKIKTAWQRAREAAWTWKKATSLDLIASVVMKKNHLAEVLRYDADVPRRAEAVASAQRLLDDAQALLDAVPEEAERWRTIEARGNRKQEYADAQGILLRMRAEQKPVAIEDVRHVADLRQQVIDDEAALRQEGKERKALLDAADVAVDNLRSLIVDALVDRLNVISKDGAAAIGKDGAIYSEYRELLDKDAPKFRKALMEARVIQTLTRDLGAELDLVVAFSNHFAEKDHAARALMESVIEGDKIKMGTHDRDQESILSMEV